MDAEEKELWARRDEPDAKSELYRRHESYLVGMIEHVVSKLPNFVDIDNLRGAAHVGIVKAMASFDPERGVEFTTYVGLRIRGAILDELRNADVSRKVRVSVKNRMQAEYELAVELGREPTVDEVCKRLGWDNRQYILSTRRADEAFSVVLARRGRSLDRPQTADDLMPVNIDRDGYAVFRELTYGMSIEEQTLLFLLYWKNNRMKDVGQVLGLSESRVSQLHSQLIARLKDRGRDYFNQAISA